MDNSIFFSHLRALICLIILSTSSIYAQNSIVVDELDCTAIAAATVFDAGGKILGITGLDGTITGIPSNGYPLTVKSMGYEPQIVPAASDSIKMIAQPFDLDELIVVNGDRNILHLTCYIREYTTITQNPDTVVAFNEHMADMLIPRHKESNIKAMLSPRLLSSRRYINTKTAEIDSVSSTDSIFSYINGIQLDTITRIEPKSFMTMNKEVKVDSLKGRYYTKEVYYKTPNAYTITTDGLSNFKKHKFSPWIFKLFGATIDFTKSYSSIIYYPSEKGIYRIEDMKCCSSTFDMTLRGKLFKRKSKTKSPVDCKFLYEIYIVDKKFITSETADDLLNEPPVNVAFEIPTTAPELDDNTKKLIQRVNAQKTID